MSKKLFGKIFILLLVVGLLFAVAPTGQAQAATVVNNFLLIYFLQYVCK